MSTYRAWDGNEYPGPPQADWYEASDGRWWPDGHGPGPAAAAPEPEPIPSIQSAMPEPALAPETAPVAPVTNDFRPPATSAAEAHMPASVEQTIAEGSGGSGRNKGAMIGIGFAAIGLAVVVGLGVFALLSGTDDVPQTVATTVPQTSEEDLIAPDESEIPETTTTTIFTGRGSLSDPYAIGETFELRYALAGETEKVWTVTVTGPAVDQTQAVLDENQFNEPPESDDLRFLVAPVRLTYVSGPELSDLFDFSFKTIGSEQLVRTTFDPSCGVIPNALSLLDEVGVGAVVEGNVCWVVPEGEIGTHVMAVEVFFTEIDAWVDITE